MSDAAIASSGEEEVAFGQAGHPGKRHFVHTRLMARHGPEVQHRGAIRHRDAGVGIGEGAVVIAVEPTPPEAPAAQLDPIAIGPAEILDTIVAVGTSEDEDIRASLDRPRDAEVGEIAPPTVPSPHRMSSPAPPTRRSRPPIRSAVA